MRRDKRTQVILLAAVAALVTGCGTELKEAEWGKVVNGLQCQIGANQKAYKSAEEIAVTLVYANRSGHEMVIFRPFWKLSMGPFFGIELDNQPLDGVEFFAKAT